MVSYAESPVKMFWNASSTLLASSAEVSMNERLLSPIRSQMGHLQVCCDSLTCELFCFFGGNSPEMSQITLITNEHDDDIRIGVIPEFLQPAGDIVIGLMFADIVDQKSSDSTSVVGRCYRAVPLLTRRVPYLCLDGLCVNLN